MTTLHFPPLPGLILHDIVIMKPARVSDGFGRWSSTFETASTVRGNLQPRTMLTPAEKEMADKMTTIITHKAFLPALTDVETQDRIVAHGKTYEVVAVMNPGGLNKWVMAYLKTVE